MSSNIKELRGQLRQLVKELLTEELVKAVEDKLRKEMTAHLDKIDARQKEITSFMVRNSVSKK